MYTCGSFQLLLKSECCTQVFYIDEVFSYPFGRITDPKVNFIRTKRSEVEKMGYKNISNCACIG